MGRGVVGRSAAAYDNPHLVLSFNRMARIVCCGFSGTATAAERAVFAATAHAYRNLAGFAPSCLLSNHDGWRTTIMVEKKPSRSLRKRDGWTALHDAYLNSVMVMSLIFWDVADKHQQYFDLAVLFYRPHRI